MRRRCGVTAVSRVRARLPSVAGADDPGGITLFHVWCLLLCGAFCRTVGKDRTVKNRVMMPKTAGSTLKKDASRLFVGGVARVFVRCGGRSVSRSGGRVAGRWAVARMILSVVRFVGSPAAPARLAPSRLVSSRLAPYFLPFTFHFLSPSAKPCETKVRIGSRPVRQ